MAASGWWTALACAVVLAGSAPAAAQSGDVLTLRPAEPARWDAAWQAGWFGGHEPEAGPRWNEWYDTGSLSASLGRYVSPHVKLELDLFTTGTGRLITNETLSVPGDPFPIFVNREHRFQTSGAAASLHYQLFDNAWFHPFVGGGVELTRESHEVETQWVSRPFPPNGIPDTTTARVDDVTVTARPFIGAGFKWYVTERAFIRSELRGAFSATRSEAVSWRAGVGFDF